MALCRLVLAFLLAVAVAVAPVRAAFVPSHDAAKPEMTAEADGHDCPATAPSRSPDAAISAKCNSDIKTKCPGDGSQCCKLTGMLVALPPAVALIARADRAADPQRPPDWSVAPRPPPPRS